MTSASADGIKYYFEKNKNKLISGGYLATKFGISRAAVWKKVRSLNKGGYKITSIANKGYRLEEPPDLIDENLLKKWISANNNFLSAVKYSNSLESTQALAKKLAQNDCINSLLVVSEKQSNSYGRMGRKWVADNGGLWMSLLLRPIAPPQKATLLTLLFSLSCAEVLEKAVGNKVLVKWPNDVYINDRKICGILTELSAELDRTKWLVLGAGINVNNKISGEIKRIAVSASEITGKKIDRAGLLFGLLENFKKKYAAFEKNGFGAFKEAYTKRLLWLGREVCVRTGGCELYAGINEGIDENGFLVLSGKKAKFVVPSGDVSIRISRQEMEANK